MNIFISKKIMAGAGVAVGTVAVLMGVHKFTAQTKEPVRVSSAPSASVIFAGAKTVEYGKSGLKNGGNGIGEIVKVARVIDGDTIEIEGGERVRYIGIDTPETVDPRKTVQCFGVEASKKNKELVEGKTVRLEKDITDRDKYKRLLRYVWLGDTLVNLALVQDGFARSYSYPPDIKYQNKFVAAERQAREVKLGLWNGCGSESSAKSVFQSQTQSSTSEQKSGNNCSIKGNISASGEKIYHISGCGSYLKTRIDEQHGERWFCSEKEAQSAGWRKAGNCP